MWRQRVGEETQNRGKRAGSGHQNRRIRVHRDGTAGDTTARKPSGTEGRRGRARTGAAGAREAEHATRRGRGGAGGGGRGAREVERPQGLEPAGEPQDGRDPLRPQAIPPGHPRRPSPESARCAACSGGLMGV